MGRRRIPAWTHLMCDLKEALDLDWNTLARRLKIRPATMLGYRKNYVVASVRFLLRLQKMEEENAEKLALYRQVKKGDGRGSRPSKYEVKAIMRSVERAKALDRAMAMAPGIESALAFHGNGTPAPSLESVGAPALAGTERTDDSEKESGRSDTERKRAGWARGWVVMPKRTEAYASVKSRRLAAGKPFRRGEGGAP